MIIKTAFILLINIFCFCNIGWAQTDLSDFSISHLTPDDGLSQGSNYFRYEDSRGFMWITGNDAVNRYDGSTVKVYNLNKYFQNCPNLQQGYGFAEDNLGNIYIGSVRGLYIYNHNTDKFRLQKIFKDTVNSEAMPFAFKKGMIWCFNKSYELATYDISENKVVLVGKIPLDVLPSIHIYDLEGNPFYYRWPCFDNNDNIWLVGKHKVVKVNSKTKEVNSLNIPDKKNLTFYSSFYDSAANDLLLGTNDGLIIQNTFTGQQLHVKKMEGVRLGEIMAVSSGSHIRVLKSSNGIVLVNRQSGIAYWEESTFRKSNRLIGFSFDKAGRLWICNDGLGQVIFNFSRKLLTKFPGGNYSSSKLKEAGVTSFAEFENGDIIAPNSYLLNHKDSKLEILGIQKNSWNTIGFRTETDKTRKGVWFLDIAYSNKLLNIYFAGNDRRTKLKYAVKESDSLGVVQQLKVLEDGRILASFSKGLCWLQKQAVVKISNQPGNSPFAINPLSKNRCAVSYLNNVMWLIELTNSTEIKFIQKILPGVQSFYVQEDSVRNQYWVGTNKGIYLLDKNFKQVKVFDANNGLKGTYIYGILLDDKGDVWCSHQRGISSINAVSFEIINYDKSDGIQDWDFNNRAFYKASDGTLYFGGISGFNCFKPPLKQFSFYYPEVYIDEIFVNNKIYSPNTNANLIQKLELSFRENNIAIKAIVKDLANANSRQLIYRIKETDTKWNYLPNNSSISFNSLSPGNYTLEMGTYDKYSNKELMQKKLLINIATPFYMELWFWVLISIFLTALLVGVYNRRKINKQQAVFNQQLVLEQQRQKITADLHDDVGASLSSLQLNSAVAGQLVHKDAKQAKLVLEKIETQAKNIADKIGDFIWSMKPDKDEFMTMSSRIRTFTNDIIGATNIDYEIHIGKEIDTLIKDFTTRKNVVLITKEAINNAVKYSKASKITIELSIFQNNIYLKIMDNGIGFLLDKITGNGIANMRKRTEELNGYFKIQSGKNKGTTLAAVMPLIP